MSQQDQRARVLALAADSAIMTVDRATLRLFDGRLPQRIAEALVKAGIDAPERLLFMSKVEIAALPGVGPAARREIEAYRMRFVPH